LNSFLAQEYAPLGTAGGIYHFRDQIRAGNPDAFFVMNGDVCADFPLEVTSSAIHFIVLKFACISERCF
jgi:NDP-sugar pyrophosphorylase family protein